MGGPCGRRLLLLFSAAITPSGPSLPIDKSVTVRMGIPTRRHTQSSVTENTAIKQLITHPLPVVPSCNGLEFQNLKTHIDPFDVTLSLVCQVFDDLLLANMQYRLKKNTSALGLQPLSL